MPNPIHFALIREDKVPVDRRVPITPAQAADIQRRFPHVTVFCQSSERRCFPDQDYRDVGIKVVDDVSHCDILMGVKEVPIPNLLADKTYLFFSHTIKEQPYNRELLRTILQKDIRLIDYERFTDAQGNRVVAFGRFAGIVGAYNGLYTYGKKLGLYDIRRAKDCFDMDDMRSEFDKIELPPIKIALTGGGRVANGAVEVLEGAGIRRVSPEDYLAQTFEEPIYTQLEVIDYNRKADGGAFAVQEFYQHPDRFVPGFQPFAQTTDLFIAGAFWDHRAPVLFHREDMLQDDFSIRVIADITCDIEGSIPSTKQPSTIADPVYDYDPAQDRVADTLYQNPSFVSVMAVDNLPSELPRDASESFGDSLMQHVMPSLLGDGDAGIIERATITQGGHLTKAYQYLSNYVANS
ncbi:MAG: NAD(P)-dependent oxidoreductase [Tunicatimonas sp.]